MMKKIFLVLIICCSHYTVFSQNAMSHLSDICEKDSTLIKIEKIEEYCLMDNSSHKVGQRIIVYVILGRYADSNHKRYNNVLQIVSLDTIVLQKDTKPFVKVIGHSYNNQIEENRSYLFHLELSGCLPIVLGSWYPFDYYEFNGIKIPITICPLQPYKALELNGLNYDDKKFSPAGFSLGLQ